MSQLFACKISAIEFKENILKLESNPLLNSDRFSLFYP